MRSKGAPVKILTGPSAEINYIDNFFGEKRRLKFHETIHTDEMPNGSERAPHVLDKSISIRVKWYSESTRFSVSLLGWYDAIVRKEWTVRQDV